MAIAGIERETRNRLEARASASVFEVVELPEAEDPHKQSFRKRDVLFGAVGAVVGGVGAAAGTVGGAIGEAVEQVGGAMAGRTSDVGEAQGLFPLPSKFAPSMQRASSLCDG